MYIVLVTALLAQLDWQIIHQTRWQHREWLDWMHAHEMVYARITRPLGAVLCTPCLVLKPVWVEALKRVEASQEEQDAITHVDDPINWYGFYHLPVRGESWTFVPWLAWFLYWLPYSVIWWVMVGDLFSLKRPWWLWKKTS